MDDKLMTVAEFNAQASDAFNSMPVVALIGGALSSHHLGMDRKSLR